MASQNPPKRATAYTYSISLVSQADTKLFKTAATLAAGDVTVSKDGGAFASVTNLPAEIGTSGVITGTLTSTEMTADRVVVRFRDAAGAEWCDALLVLDTVASNQFDDLATATALATVDGNVDSILEDTGTTLPAAIADVPTNAELASGLAAADDATLAAIAGISVPSASSVADAVWDEALAGHAAAGSAGAGLSAAGSAGDPWTTELPATYTGVQAGAIMSDIWAANVGGGEADDPANPTQVAYEGPDGQERLVHSLTPTTRTKTP